MPRFSDEEIRRYGRQILLREVGGGGQERLRAARAHLRGEGPILETAARYLLRAGLIHLSIRVPTQAAALAATLADDCPADAALDVVGQGADAPGALFFCLHGEAQPSVWAGSLGGEGEVGVGCPCARRIVGAGRDHPLAGPLLGAQLALVVLRLVVRMDADPGRRARLQVDLDGPEVLAGSTWAPLPDCTCAAPCPEASYLSP